MQDKKGDFFNRGPHAIGLMPEEATPAAQSPAAETAAPAPETMSTAAIVDAMANATIIGNDAEYSRLEALLKPPKEEAKPAEEAAPVEETPTEQAAEKLEVEAEETVVEAEAEPESGEQPTEETKEQKRYRFKGEDKLIADLAKQRGISLAEAARILAPAEAKVETTQPVKTAAEQVAQTITDLETEVAELEQKYAQTFEADAMDGGLPVLNGRLIKAQAKLEAKKELAASLAQQEAAAREKTAAQIKSEWKTLEATNKSDYPDLAKTDSVQSLVYAGLVREWSNPENPNHSKLFEVNAPKLLADESARLTGKTPKTTAAPKPAPPKKEVARPAPGSRTTSPPATEPSPEQRLAAAEADMNAAMVGRSGAQKRSHSGTLIIR